MLLDLILIIITLSLIVHSGILYILHKDFVSKRLRVEPPRQATFMRCHFCKVELPWNTKRITNGHLVCSSCKSD